MKTKKKAISRKIEAEASNVAPSPTSGWTFLTNHTHVLLCLYRAPESTTREVAALVGITERMVQKIVAELVESGFMEVNKVGRRNTYKIHVKMTLRHPLESHRRIGDLLEHLTK
jgi:DNA-binding MarR family transcriptional regulator